MAVHHPLRQTTLSSPDPPARPAARPAAAPSSAARPAARPAVPPSSAARSHRSLAVFAGAAVASGVLVALSLPPFGWWPLGVAGLGNFAALLDRRNAGGRVLIGAGVGFGQYAIGLWWVNEFSVPGYVLLLLLSMAFTAVAGLAVPARRRGVVLIALPAALMATDWLRGHVPFGGLPLGGTALGQVGGPLVPVARVGGPVLVTGVTAAAGAALAHLVLARPPRPPSPEGAGRPLRARRPSWSRRPTLAVAWVVPPAVTLASVVALVCFARLSPDGGGGGARRSLSVAAVQGGGPLGLHAAETDRPTAFHNQLQASAMLHGPLELVLWPEDVITEDLPITQSPDATTAGQLAQRLGATVVAGVVENVGETQFRNAAVAWAPNGTIVARYDKVHRVPFGEYIPGRGLFKHLANLDLVPRDAIAGHGPGILDTPAGPLGTVISYEVFFQDRARSAIRAGGEVLLVPTNASSYSTSQVPAQEVAAAQLEAWSTGREVVQAAPTGFSALIDADGRVRARTSLGRQQTLVGRVGLRTGRTLYVRLGDTPILVLAVLTLVGLSMVSRRPG